MHRTLMLFATVLLGAAVPLATAAAASDDPLQAPECRQALAALHEEEAAAASAPAALRADRRDARAVDPKLDAARRRAARSCLASRADPPLPGRLAQPPIAVPPVVGARPPLPAASAPSVAIPTRPPGPPALDLDHIVRQRRLLDERRFAPEPRRADALGTARRLQRPRHGRALPVTRGAHRARRSLAQQMQRDLATMRLDAVLPQIDALPGAEHEPTLADRNRDLRRRQRRADMPRHVVEAFFAMAKDRVAVGNEPRHVAVEVGAHFGRGVLLDQQARRRVADEERQEPGREAALGDPRFERARDLEQAAARRVEAERGVELAEHARSIASRASPVTVALQSDVVRRHGRRGAD